jgi:hypothetical protein
MRNFLLTGSVEESAAGNPEEAATARPISAGGGHVQGGATPCRRSVASYVPSMLLADPKEGGSPRWRRENDI